MKKQNSQIKGGSKKSSNTKAERNAIIETISAPGYVYILAKNQLGSEVQKIRFNFDNTDSISVINNDAWNSHQDRNEIVLGGNLILKCRVSFFNDIVWKHFFTNISDVKAFKHEIELHDYTRTQIIEIKNVSHIDSGWYSCFDSYWNKMMYHKSRNPLIKTLNVEVIGKEVPKIESNFEDHHSTTMERSIGEDLELKCDVSQMSIRSFRLFKDNKPMIAKDSDDNKIIKLDTFSVSVKFKKLTEKDQGMYSCVATNVFGQDEKNVTISFPSEFPFQLSLIQKFPTVLLKLS